MLSYKATGTKPLNTNSFSFHFSTSWVHHAKDLEMSELEEL